MNSSRIFLVKFCLGLWHYFTYICVVYTVLCRPNSCLIFLEIKVELFVSVWHYFTHICVVYIVRGRPNSCLIYSYVTRCSTSVLALRNLTVVKCLKTP